MILDEKVIMFSPPPPYLLSPSSRSSTSTLVRPHNPQANLNSLPAHILLQIIHHCFPQDPSLPPPSYLSSSSSSRQYAEQLRLYQDTKPEKQRKTLYWLATSLRLVSRQLYTACMHVLRSTYLPAYQSLIRPPYTSDPFPLSVPTTSGNTLTSSSTGAGGTAPSSSSIISTNGPPAYDPSSSSITGLPTSTSPSTPTFPPTQPPFSPLLTLHRETPILDRFIALKVRQDVLADESELHLDREDSFRDLFEVAQPRARLEDLVRVYGVREGVVCVPSVFYASNGGQGQGQGRVYGGTGSRSSSLVSLPQTPSSPAPSVPSFSITNPPPQSSSSSTPTPKTRRSIFSFGSKKPSPSATPPPQTPPQTQPTIQKGIQPIPFSSLSISFSPRRVGLMVNRSRTIAEVPRLGVGRNREPLEALARALVGELKVALGG